MFERTVARAEFDRGLENFRLVDDVIGECRARLSVVLDNIDEFVADLSQAFYGEAVKVAE